MRRLTAFLLIGFCVIVPILLLKGKSGKAYFKAPATTASLKDKSSVLLRLKNHGANLMQYALRNNLNSHYCFLVDMSVPSGEYRFFVYDLKGDSTLVSGLVTHGSGKDTTSAVRFSNQPESNCTSIGKYKIGNAYNGKFGLAYKLYGLDKTNSNAFNRFVVLHSHACVPLMEVAPQKICESWGCPTVAPVFLQALKKYIDKADKPLLLWIYN